MEQQVTPILAAVTTRLHEWIEDRVRQTVVSQPEIVESLGPEAIRAIKTKTEDLLAKIPSLVEQHVGAEKVWAHRGAFHSYGNNNVDRQARGSLESDGRPRDEGRYIAGRRDTSRRRRRLGAGS